jgi:hypothetical protein
MSPQGRAIAIELDRIRLNSRLALRLRINLWNRYVSDYFRQWILILVRRSVPPWLRGKAYDVLVCHFAAIGEDETVPGFAFAELADHLCECLHRD